MAEELSSLHIDTDWKKQAQEEKRRLAEEEQKRASAAPPAAPAIAAVPGAPPEAAVARGAGASRGRGGRELPQASFASLVQGLVTQALFYLGDLAAAGTEPNVNLDMAKHQIDTMDVLEEKTRSNLSEEETRLLDAALYEARMRYVAVASQYI